jgi:hypothetical protein
VSQTIEITVDLKGNTTVITKGFTGSSCQEASRFVERAVGSRTSERLTAEFYQSRTVQQTRHQQPN